MIELDTLTLAGVIIAIVSALKGIVPQYVTGLVTIAVAVLVGAVSGYFGLFGLTVVGVTGLGAGITAGLLAVGVHTTFTDSSGK